MPLKILSRKSRLLVCPHPQPWPPKRQCKLCTPRNCTQTCSSLDSDISQLQRLSDPDPHPQWPPGEEAQLLRRGRRPLQGCHCPPLLHNVQHGCEAEQVGSLGIQEQAARLHKSPEEAGKQDQEGDQARHPRGQLGGPLRALHLAARHPLCLLQGDGQNSGQHIWHGSSARPRSGW